MRLETVLKTIQARTEITIWNKGRGFYFSSYPHALQSLKEQNPDVLESIVIEIQANEYRDIHLVTQ